MANQVVQHPVPLMLRKILQDKMNGELIVKGDDFMKTLYFHEGILVFAKTTVIEERLGEILFKIGKIDRTQFKEILQLMRNQNEKLGKLLVQNGILNQRDIFFGLLYQLRTIATSIFSLSSGEWLFMPKTANVPSDSRFNIELPGIIAEGTNKISNFSYFRNKFHAHSLRLSTIPQNISEFLSTFEINFYKELTANKTLPLEQLSRELDISPDTFWKKIILFYLLNVVEFTDSSVDVELDQNVEEVIRLFEKLKSGKIDYYKMFDLPNTATFNEIKEAYFNYAKKYHPDRIANAPDPDIADKANFVFAEINRAYETLSDDEKRREYDTVGYKETGRDETIKEHLLEKARLLYRKGKSLYAQKKYMEAASTMDEAVKLDNSKASYFLLLGLCQMNVQSLRRMAEKNLQNAIDMEHWNVEAYAAMGILFMSENQLKRAEGFFRKVLSFNPDHPLARKKLEEIANQSTGQFKKSGFSLFGKSKK